MRHTLLSLLLAALVLTLPPGFKATTAVAADVQPARIEVSNSFERSRTKQGDIATIETYTSGLDRYIKRNAQRARYFADTSSYENENAPARWQEFKTKKALDNAWQNGKTYTSSNVWFSTTGNPVVALFTLSSPSGDWAQYVTNYYRSDGTLARLHSELRTFMGDVIVIRDRLYDANGKVLKEQTRYLDLKTRKPKKVKQGDFMDQEATLYAKTSALPFYALLKKR
ncbi:MAG TPA: hypothetical protein VGC66_18410 [Pyrinomonadaceae bacterium]|jgi:hypothetical protein